MARGGGTGSRATKKKKADAGTAAPAQQNGVDRENKNVSDADKHQTTQKHRKQKVKILINQCISSCLFMLTLPC